MILPLVKGLSKDLSQARQHWREHGFQSLIAWLNSRDAPLTFQFSKYVVFGALTTIVHLALFTGFSHSFLPAHDYLMEGGMSNELQERNAILSNLLAFPIAVIVNYFFNVKFVFTSGRHSRIREFILFVSVSFLSFSIGLFSGPFFISQGLNPWFAQAGLTITSALVNFICRKFLIFLK
ncbi:MAG: GtrA family protein [Verrucomicrobiales bacterium]|nr:GtrA family protein [Verrucomicrobiales bacterium]